jgi:hypothetical protein
MSTLCSTKGRTDVIAILTIGRMRSASFCLLAASLVGGCAGIGPKPWEKDLMARHEMQVTAYAMQAKTDQHIYFSREASSGGRGFAGGGCGCN